MNQWTFRPILEELEFFCREVPALLRKVSQLSEIRCDDKAENDVKTAFKFPEV